MDLSFRDALLRKRCASKDAIVRAWGPTVAPVLCRRLAQLAAAGSVAVVRRFPFCALLNHPDGQYTLVCAPLFLICFATSPTNPVYPPNGEEEITAIEIIAIERIDEP